MDLIHLSPYSPFTCSDSLDLIKMGMRDGRCGVKVEASVLLYASLSSIIFLHQFSNVNVSYITHQRSFNPFPMFLTALRFIEVSIPLSFHILK
jgi:hypothetical protein